MYSSIIYIFEIESIQLTTILYNNFILEKYKYFFLQVFVPFS